MRPSLLPLASFAVALVSAPLACQNKSTPTPAASSRPSASAAPASPAPSGRPVRVVDQSPARGSERHDLVTRRMQFDPLEPGSPGLTIDERLERDVKVLETNEKSVTKVELRYGKVTTSVKEGHGPAQETTDPRSGKTYVLTQQLGQLMVLAPDGTEVTGELAQSITSDHVSLGLPFPLPSLLPDEPLMKGDDFDLSHDAVLALFPVDADGDFDVTRVTLVFEGEPTPKTLAFAVKTRFWGVHGGRRIELDLEGSLIARAPGAWPERVSLEGPAKLLAQAGDEPAGARPGRAKIALRSTYR